MPKRSREEKLAAYSKGAKRGYRARKAFVAANGLEMKNPPPGKVEGSIGHSGGVSAGRALGNAGPGYAAPNASEKENERTCKLKQNAQVVNRVIHPLF
jgi:hypothetical protein